MYRTDLFSIQGVPYARMSQLCEAGEIMERCFTDVSTLYEAFARGARVSSKLFSFR